MNAPPILEHSKHVFSFPPDEAVIDRLVGTVLLWGVTPSQSTLDEEFTTANQPAVFYPRNPLLERKTRLTAAHLSSAQKEQVRHRLTSQT